MKVKVIEFIGSMNDGGAETLVKDYAILLDKAKFEIQILTIYGLNNSANSNRIKKNNIEISSVFRNRTIITRLIKKTIGKWYIPIYMMMIILKKKPKVLHVHLELLKYVASIRKILNYYNVKIVYTCHNVPERYFFNNNSEFKAAKKLLRYNNLQMIALHNQMKQQLNNMFNIDDTIVITNGINFDEFKLNKRDRNSFRIKIGLKTSDFVIGHIGRFNEQKNHLFILKIFKSVLTEKSNAKLLLIGKGELKNHIKKMVRNLGLDEFVIFLQDREDIPDLLLCMDVFLFPSLYEGLSITLIEAQVAGLKCVVSDTINEESFLSKKVHPLSLEYPIKTWKNAILYDDFELNNYGKIEEYNLKNSIKKIEEVYTND